MTPAHRRFSARWLAVGGVTVLAGILGVALLLQTGASSACAASAAAPPTSTPRKGKATFYDLAGTTGNCSFDGPPADGLFVALGATEYSGAAACGSYLDVTGPKGKVRVKVIDSCPPCAAGHIDLSRKAFGRIANHVTGIVPVTYRAVVNAPVPGPLTVRLKDGASRWWFAARLDNHANPLRSVQVRSPGGSWRSANREDYNFWIVDGGAGGGPFSIRVRDIHGRSATVTGIKLIPEKTQRTSVRMYGTATGPAGRESTRRSPTGSPSPSRSAAAVTSSSAAVPPTDPPTESISQAHSPVPAASTCRR